MIWVSLIGMHEPVYCYFNKSKGPLVSYELKSVDLFFPSFFTAVRELMQCVGVLIQNYLCLQDFVLGLGEFAARSQTKVFVI
jgi:hypothetical protein